MILMVWSIIYSIEFTSVIMCYHGFEYLMVGSIIYKTIKGLNILIFEVTSWHII